MPTPTYAKLGGVGLTTVLGNGKAANLAGLLKAKPQYQQQELTQFSESLQGSYLKIVLSQTAATAEQRMHSLLDASVSEALEEAELDAEDIEQVPVFIGSSSYAIAIAEELYQNSLAKCTPENAAHALPIPLDGFSQISERLQSEHGFYGADFPYNTACTASANAIMAASQAIRCGHSRHALVVGMETFNVTTVSGFAGMQLLANDVMRPFDRRRNGLVLGEGCAALLFHAASDDPGLSVCGAASQCDTHSISASNPDGTSIAAVMRAALADAGITADSVAAIKAHGTASPLNDNGEAAALHQVFQEIPPVFCIKPYVGHTLGACGAIELALLSTTLQANVIPASAGFSDMDPELNISPITEARPADAGFYMLNFFGFGGNNSSIIVRHKPVHGE